MLAAITFTLNLFDIPVVHLFQSEYVYCVNSDPVSCEMNSIIPFLIYILHTVIAAKAILKSFFKFQKVLVHPPYSLGLVLVTILISLTGEASL